MEIDEKKLVRQAAAGDKQSFQVLVEKYQQRAFVLARSVVRSSEDAEDVVQESFVKAYLSLKKFKGESSFYTWLYRIVYNMAIDFTRKRARRGGTAAEFDDGREVTPESSVAMGTVEGPQESYFRGELRSAIQSALATLSDEHRTVVVLREFEGMSYDDIADAVGISRGTVMSRLHYARKQLQSSLQNLDTDGAAGSEKGETVSKEMRVTTF